MNSKLLNIFLKLCLILMPVCISGGANAFTLVDRVVVIVNDDIITLVELNEAMAPFKKKIESLGYPPEKERSVLYDIRQNIIEKLIDKKLTDQEIKKAGITVGDKEIDMSIERIKEANFYTDEDLRSALRNDGMTMDDYREKTRGQIERARLVNRQIKSKIVVTDEDVEAYYRKHYEQYSGEEKYHLRNIIKTFSYPVDDQQKAEIKKEMVSVVEKINAGASFAETARMYSDLGVAKNGGDLGFFSLKELSPVIRDAVKGLKPGAMTDIIETDLGYQVFLVEDIREMGGRSLEDATPEISSKLYNEIVEEKYRKWLNDLKSEAHIKIIK